MTSLKPRKYRPPLYIPPIPAFVLLKSPQSALQPPTMASVLRTFRAPIFRASPLARPIPIAKLPLARAFTFSALRSATSEDHGSSGPPQLYGPGGKAGEVPTEYVCFCMSPLCRTRTACLAIWLTGIRADMSSVRSKQPVSSDSSCSVISWVWTCST